MNRVKRKSTLVTVSILQLFLAVSARAQARDLNSFTTMIKSLLKGVSEHIVDIALILIGLVGAVMCVPNLIKHSRTDPNASDAFVKLGVGIVIAVVIVQIARLLF